MTRLLFLWLFVVSFSEDLWDKTECPESEITFTGSDGQSHNLESYIIEALDGLNETLNDNMADSLVNELIIGILSVEEGEEEGGEGAGRRRLAGYRDVIGVRGGWSRNFGGGGGDLSYTDPNRIKRVCLRTGGTVDRIWVEYTSGGWSSQYGGGGGHENCWLAGTGCISGVHVRHGNMVDGLMFIADNGDMSPYFGGSGGTHTTIHGYGKCLDQLRIGHGNRVDNIGFHFETSYPVPAVAEPPLGCVSIKSHQWNKFISAQESGNHPLYANRDSVGGWEKHVISKAGNNRYAIKSQQWNKYWRAESNGNIDTRAEGVGMYETFEIMPCPGENDCWLIRSCWNLFLSARNKDECDYCMKANIQQTGGGWERIQIHSISC